MAHYACDSRACVILGVALVALATIMSVPGIAFLKPDEQLLVTTPSTIYVVDGPKVTYYAPLINRATKRKALQLREKEYATFKDTLTGAETIVAGPTLHFMGAYETHEDTLEKIVLTDKQYVRLLDTKSGRQRVVRGPATVVPEPLESYEEGVQNAIVLTDKQYVRLLDTKSGKQRIVRGPATVVPEPLESYKAGVQNAIKLEEMEYLVVTDTLTGAQVVQEGPQLFFPDVHDTAHETREKLALKKNEYSKVVDAGTGEIRVVRGPRVLVPTKATERLGPIEPAFELLKHQYVRLVDQATGTVRVERGEAIIVPGPNEHAIVPSGHQHAVQDAVMVDDETAVLVASKNSGQQRLVTTKGLFFPDRYDEIVEVRKLIRVEPHEVVVARDNDGGYHFYSGDRGSSGSSGGDAKKKEGTAFFLQPHHELVTMMWSSGTSPNDAANNVVRNAKQVAYKVPVTKIDMRAQYAFFEYTVRTSDNVELVLEGTIFWQVSDVRRMIERTGDPKGDVWYHARSALIQAVSLVTLETFMSSFNALVVKAAETDKAFYEERGVVLHNLEVVRYEPKDDETARVLQKIIQETTNHINRMQQQKSENEVEKEKMVALIEIERQRADLIKEKTANEKLQSQNDGEAEGTRLAQSTLAFLEQLNTSVSSEESRLELLKFFAEQKTAVEHSRRYASNPRLTTVIEGGSGSAASVKPEMRVEMKEM